MFKIKITHNGPYVVEGKMNLKRETVEEMDGMIRTASIESLDGGAQTHLCRCGKSTGKPFCDGSHETSGFDGTETADKSPYLARIRLHEGFGVDLADDGRCCASHKCHMKNTDIVSLVSNFEGSSVREEVIEAACKCPSGRFTAVEYGQLVEKVYEPSIVVSHNVGTGISAGLHVKGDFILEGADGVLYEKRNRMSLCRCGNSANKPFCDGAHIESEFNDRK